MTDPSPDQAPAPLELSPPEDGQGSTGWLAGKLGVSRQTVLNWHRDGLPSSGIDPRRGGPLFDLVVSRQWQREHRGGTLHGGKRRGGGRPPAKSSGELVGELASADVAALNREQAVKLFGDLVNGTAGPVETPLRHEVIPDLDDARLTILLALNLRRQDLPPSAIGAFEDIRKIRKMDMDLAERRGDLHDAAACNAATTANQTLLRTKLLGLPGRAAAAVVSAGRLGPELVPVVKQALQAAVDEVMREIAENPLGGIAA